MMYEVKFGLIGFAIGTVAISASTLASDIGTPASHEMTVMQAPAEHIALLPSTKPAVFADKLDTRKASPPAAPMSAWRRDYIARHGHQPPVPAA
jgi:hypothetical protein